MGVRPGRQSVTGDTTSTPHTHCNTFVKNWLKMCIICYNVYVRLINTSVHRTLLRTVVIGRLQWRIQNFPWKGGGREGMCTYDFTTFFENCKKSTKIWVVGWEVGVPPTPSSANGLCMYCELSWPTFTCQARWYEILHHHNWRIYL